MDQDFRTPSAEAIQVKLAEVKDEWNDVIFALSECAGSTFKRAQQLLTCHNEEPKQQCELDNSSICEDILSELNLVSRKCQAVRCLLNKAESAEICRNEITKTLNDKEQTLPKMVEDSTAEGTNAGAIGDDEPTDKVRFGTGLRVLAHDVDLTAEGTTAGTVGDDEPTKTDWEDPLTTKTLNDKEQTLSKTVVDSTTEGATAGTVRDEDSMETVYKTPSLGMIDSSEYDGELPSYAPFPTGGQLGTTVTDVFSVKVSNSLPLVRGVRMKLDKVEKVAVFSDSFDRDDAVFKPTCDGVYALSIEMCQRGHGEIELVLCRPGHISYAGKTCGDLMLTSTLKVKDVAIGQEHWLAVRLVRGHASVYWCNFSAFFIAKFPGAESQNDKSSKKGK